MEDHYIEHLIKREPQLKNKLVFIAFLLLNIICLISAFLLHPYFLVGSLLLLVFSFLYTRKMHLEYEYLLIGNTLTIDAIENQSKRKQVLDLDFAKVISLNREGDQELMNTQAHRTYDFSTGSSLPPSEVLVCHHHGENVWIKLSLDEECKEYLRTHLGSRYHLG